MEKVRAIFDRRHKVAKTGKGAVEIYISLANKVKKYIPYTSATPEEWSKIETSAELAEELGYYRSIMQMLVHDNEELTLDNFNRRIGYVKPTENNTGTAEVVKKSKKGTHTFCTFTDFIFDSINKEKIQPGTKRHKTCSLNAIIEFGKLTNFEDVTEDNVRAFDKWLNKSSRTEATVYTYHKHLKKWCRLAFEQHLIDESPYVRVHFSRGKSKERKPLLEHQLVAIRDIKLKGHLERARDLFIFSAYTGLAYCDVMNFNFKEMSVKMSKRYFIDGNRIKTGSDFFTPILQPALDILKKYDYKLPKMSNQKVNDYIKIVATLLEITTPVSFHVARHSFATLCLTHDVPIEKVARMLGHQDIKTTQIYAKTLQSAVQKHTEALAASLL